MRIHSDEFINSHGLGLAANMDGDDREIVCDHPGCKGRGAVILAPDFPADIFNLTAVADAVDHHLTGYNS